ncbi:hypothetical protein EXU48_01120 [Occultella glacieicola]|uniref:MinD-like ATPase involved in chromosome partitioning or flagellar assembly n=1 Tax=Occultella glacieicola TaxID=2518684 RepID=A0ABY2EAN9_9MICO|nr:hypothetical protein [Occultella glacieicola]TDE98833.1 hypothetical protein EXU48_01120 [Occultella glacieicola]
MSFDNVPPHPRVSARIEPDGAAEVIFDGVPHYLRSGSLPGARRDMTVYVAQRAREVLGRAVLVHVSEPEGRFELAVHPDGKVDERPSHEPVGEPAAGAADPEATVMTRSRPPEVPAGQAMPSAPAGPEAPFVPERPSEPSESVRGPEQPAVDPGSEPAVGPSAPEPRPESAVGPQAAEPQTFSAPQGQPATPDHWAPPPRPAAPGVASPGGAATLRPEQGPVAPQSVPVAHRTHPGPAAGPTHPTTVVPFPAPQQPPSSMPSSVPSSVPPPPPSGPPFSPSPSAPSTAANPVGPGGPAPTRRELRESFLTQEQVEAPATTGLRGVLARAGIKTAPSASERSERADRNTVSQHWPGVRTIAVVNGKGGANKTPTTALLAAVFARNSGAATLAWDNNVTRGTLGWRTDQGTHEATVLDLLPEVDNLLSPGAKAGDISHYVHHQAADKYDVLRSNPNLLSSATRISAADVDAIHDVAGRYYRLVFVDSGNDESAENWLRMIDKADQLVVASIAKPEHAEAGALLLEELVARGGRSADLARGAVVVVSQAREKDHKPAAVDIAKGFGGWVRETVTIPYDRAMVESVLRFDALAPATQRAWLRAGAAVASGL